MSQIKINSSLPNFQLPTFFQNPFESLQKSFKSMSYRSRILKETKVLQTNEIPGISPIPTDNLHVLYIDINVKNNTLYPDTYRAKIMLPEEYPFVPPVCLFVTDLQEGISTIPMHPHIYSNGHICLDLLGPGWTPIHSISSLAISLQSFLASNSTNERPPDDESYVRRGSKDPSKTKFVYHDDNV